MLPNSGPGRLIVIEGLDGAGTTTQVRLLAQRLSRFGEVYVTHEPSEGPVGLLIRLALEHRIKVSDATLAALFAADRMDHLYCQEGNKGIVSQLAQGFHVLTDRYYLSSLAYQGISLDWQWIWDMHAHCVRPDVTVFVEVPVDVCLQRIASGRGSHFDLFENRKVLTHARQSYLCAIDRLHRAGIEVEVIDGDAPPNQVHAAIWEHVKVLLKNHVDSGSSVER
jgi:dTMP kinase